MSEAHEQAALIQWADLQAGKYTPLRWLHHIPNGGSRNPREARNLKLQGVRSGVADVFLPYPSGGKHGLYIEMKYGKNRLTSKQREFLEYAASVGYATAVCYSAEEAITAIRNYLGAEDHVMQ